MNVEITEIGVAIWLRRDLACLYRNVALENRGVDGEGVVRIGASCRDAILIGFLGVASKKQKKGQE